MKKILKSLIEIAYGAKVHANHTAIKGRKSGGSRDSNGVDWKTVRSGNNSDDWN